jgi:hypothetical protein
MALRPWASFTRLDKLKIIPRGACVSLPAGRQPGLALRATKGEGAQPAMFSNRVVSYFFAAGSGPNTGNDVIRRRAAP